MTTPPPLPFSLRAHRVGISVFWTAIATEVCLVPLGLYYGLWFGTSLDHGALFAIITSVFGLVSGTEYAQRTWRLAQPSARYRPGGSGRWAFDATHFLLAIPYTVTTALLVGFSIPREPLVRGLASPFGLAYVFWGLSFVLASAAHARGWSVPFRLSSTAAGRTCPPLGLVVLEDVVAVDGGCPAFREALGHRWRASPRFRAVARQVSWAWGVSALLVGAGTVAAVWSLASEAVAYGVGWGVPSLHALLAAAATAWWVRRALRAERSEWARDAAAPGGVEGLRLEGSEVDSDGAQKAELH